MFGEPYRNDVGLIRAGILVITAYVGLAHLLVAYGYMSPLAQTICYATMTISLLALAIFTGIVILDCGFGGQTPSA